MLLQLTCTQRHPQSGERGDAGKDYGIKGIDGTGPWCFESWQPRTEIVLNATRLQMGPVGCTRIRAR